MAKGYRALHPVWSVRPGKDVIAKKVLSQRVFRRLSQEPFEAFHFPMASKSRSGIATITAGGGLNSQGLPGTAPFMEGAPRLHLWPF